MDFLTYIKDHTVVLDGGMGTLLQSAGLGAGELPERWNLSHPLVIRDIHRDYLRAGSHVINTNTFGANLLKFSHEELENIVCTAVCNARMAQECASVSHPTWVALDIGPCGKLLKPYGDLDFEDAVALFAATVRLGVKYGVDLITVETMNDSYETKAALLAVKENCSLPVIVTNAYGEDGKLMTGAKPAAMVAMLEGMGADVIGLNCSLGPRQLRGVIRELLENASVPVAVKPNAGLPRNADGKTVYDITPEEFAEELAEAVHGGVRAVGGCCGTTPEYIQRTVDKIKNITPKPIEKKAFGVVSSYTHAVRFEEDRPVLIGERINPTGKKRFKQALVEHDLDYILREGLRQQECGVQVLDVNVGLPDIDESEMLCETVCELQAILDLPLQIDTASPAAMERALRRYNGKAMINSVNGKRESMDAIFPLVKKYGGMVVALTLDEQGIPSTAEGRLEIAARILRVAESYSVDRRDIIFDPLTMTVSTDPQAANVTLEAVRRIRGELGCLTSLGVSNVSFGLPARDTVNSIFFTLALQSGLGAAIMNPYSAEMMGAYHAYRALRGYDANCADYVSFAAALPAPTAVSASSAAIASAPAAAEGTLRHAVIKGLREQAGVLTAKSLADGAEPMTLVREEIIPALDEVGRGFEEKTVYLPQLLMSAEAARAASEQIKLHLSQTKEQTAERSGAPVVIATVAGDIHDIGKNIVKLLLENYGFRVVDLGKDVAPEKIADEVVRLGAPLCGLSALMTTTVPAMEETIRLLRARAPHCRVMVGGAVLNRDYAERIGADFYGKDAMEAVRYAEQICGE
ncbi:MAG: homocysteine S-methyltransferase family protein [Clostridia bacterium]|nr:homocysteine S-methyltransferase family protein [Clostridia bacterium]